ncbi:hypothetical protein Sjap_010734 [Stephania japonica]|uniref:Uncharacterized protein n=1 Tax=Stephania japonica TaxID=461633 RepID=A0AAP0JC69_9MAGN
MRGRWEARATENTNRRVKSREEIRVKELREASHISSTRTFPLEDSDIDTPTLFDSNTLDIDISNVSINPATLDSNTFPHDIDNYVMKLDSEISRRSSETRSVSRSKPRSNLSMIPPLVQPRRTEQIVFARTRETRGYTLGFAGALYADYDSQISEYMPVLIKETHKKIKI